MVAVGTFLFFKTLNETLQVKKKKKKEKISSVLEINSPNTFGRRKHPQAYASHLNTAFTPKTANARHPGGKKTCTQTKPKSKRLNHSVNLLEFGLESVGSLVMPPCLRIKGFVGIPALYSYSLLYSPLLRDKGQLKSPIMSLF